MPKWLTDSNIHTPPTSGTYDYNAFTPASGSFPAVGGTYVDPVFGGTVRRLTDAYSASRRDDHDNYSHHWANADGTLCFARVAGTAGYILNTTTGATAYSGQPVGSVPADMAWHPTDPDKYFYFSGASLMRRNLAAQTDTTIKTFAASLEEMGGTENWIDRTGRYFLAQYSTLMHLWDSQTDTIYTGAFTPFGGTGWSSLTPDGNYIVDVTGPSGTDAAEHYAYAINHGTQTVNVASPNQFWGLSRDHISILSASDGKNYAVSVNDYDSDGTIYRVDISLNQLGRTAAQQKADNTVILSGGGGLLAAHFSGVGRGTYSDWMFISTEDSGDTFDGGITGWKAHEQEIIAVNLVTLEKRRIAHHRSRSEAVHYNNNPRVSCSWDGSCVIWTSNFNAAPVAGFNELYAINDPLTEDRIHTGGGRCRTRR